MITGVGKHSQNGVAKLQPAVAAYLTQNNLPWQEAPNNPGAFNVSIAAQWAVCIVLWSHGKCLWSIIRLIGNTVSWELFPHLYPDFEVFPVSIDWPQILQPYSALRFWSAIGSIDQSWTCHLWVFQIVICISSTQISQGSWNTRLYHQLD